MKSTQYRKLLKSRGETGARYYGWQLRSLLNAPPEKFPWGRVLPLAFSLAMLGGIAIAFFTDGPMRLVAALSVLGIGLAIPVISRLTR